MTTANLLNTAADMSEVKADVSVAFDHGRKAGGAIEAAASFLRGLGAKGAKSAQKPMIAGYMASILWPNSKARPASLLRDALLLVERPNASSKSNLKRTVEEEAAYSAGRMFFSRANTRAGNVVPNTKKKPTKKPNVAATTSTDVVTGGNVPTKAVTPGLANAQELEAYLLLQAVAMATTVRKNGSHASVAVKNAVAEFHKALKEATIPH